MARASPDFLSVRIEFVSSRHMQVENHAVHSFASMYWASHHGQSGLCVCFMCRSVPSCALMCLLHMCTMHNVISHVHSCCIGVLVNLKFATMSDICVLRDASTPAHCLHLCWSASLLSFVAVVVFAEICRFRFAHVCILCMLRSF